MHARIVLFLACLLASGAALAETSPGLSSSLYKLDLMQAKNGSPEAQFSLAGRFEEGRGVQRDMARAIEWYKRSAAAGYAPAQYKLGLLYEAGTGVAADPEQAQVWLRRAAQNGSGEARHHLDDLAAAEARREAEVRAARERAERERLAREKRERLARAKHEQDRRTREATAERRRLAAITAVPTPSAAATAARGTATLHIPDLRAAVLEGKWYAARRPAEYLPSPLTSCLGSGEDQVICFSQPNTRTVGAQKVTYTVKSVLSDFRPDGRFSLNYQFNVTELARAAATGPASAPDGLQAKKGWQQPGQGLRCRARDRTTLDCTGAGGEQRFVAY